MMHRHRLRVARAWLGLIAVALIAPAGRAAPAGGVPTPESMIGFRVGADFKLARWEQILAYFKALDAASDRVVVQELGKSTEGAPLIVAAISSPDTIAHLDRYRALQAKLADPRRLASPADEAALLAEAKVVIYVNCGLHSSEVGSSQMSMELAYLLATGDDERTREILDHCIILLAPSSNPDGNNKVVDWYERTLGTPFEAAPMPWLYHYYTGHDDNRDWFMLTQRETQLVTQFLFKEWFPSVVYDVHQMGNLGARLFVPPFYDPINPNVHPLIDQSLFLIGGHMASALAQEGKTGVIYEAIYDVWWQGALLTTAARLNSIGVLTEAASANLASPIFQRFSDLRGYPRGLDAYGPRVNFPDPWPGGWWRVRDIVDYEETAAFALFSLAARYHTTFLKNQLALGKEAVEKGKTEPPFAYLVPPDQRDPGVAAQMLRILEMTGLEVHRARAAFTADGVSYPAGTAVLLCAQPFRAHLKDLMERQEYPSRTLYPGGPPEPPYDVAGWTLPLQMGVRTVAVVSPFTADLERLTAIADPRESFAAASAAAVVCPNTRNADVTALLSFLKEGFEVRPFAPYVPDIPAAPGAMTITPGRRTAAELAAYARAISARLPAKLIPVELPARTGGLGQGGPVQSLSLPRVGLYESWVANMDAGWTRFVLEQHEIPYTVVHNAELRAGDLRKRFDCLIFPDASLGSILDGHAATSVPPPYAGGIGPDGVLRLQEFAEQGGTLVLMDSATALATEQFGVPVRDVLSGVASDKFFCPGSILRIKVKTGHPLGYGLPAEAAAYFTASCAFEIGPQAYTGMPAEEAKAKAARYPTVSVADYSDTVLLLSGWIRGDDLIKGKSAVAEVQYGKGRLVLLGFRVQHRGQPHGTFRFLFNAILESGMSN